MTTNPMRAVERHLGAHEEAWKADHDGAMECFDLEEWLANCIWLYDFLEDADDLFRSRVFRGVVEPGHGHEQVQEGYRRWMAVADEVGRDLPRLTADYGPLDRADEFRDRVQRAKERMARPAQKLAIAPGSRTWDVTEDEADELAATAAAPSTLTVTPLDIPTAPASLIR